MPPPIKVELVPHSADWEIAGSEVSAEIRAVFGSLIVEVHHTDSMAIPGISAKPNAIKYYRRQNQGGT